MVIHLTTLKTRSDCILAYVKVGRRFVIKWIEMDMIEDRYLEIVLNRNAVRLEKIRKIERRIRNKRARRREFYKIAWRYHRTLLAFAIYNMVWYTFYIPICVKPITDTWDRFDEYFLGMGYWYIIWSYIIFVLWYYYPRFWKKLVKFNQLHLDTVYHERMKEEMVEGYKVY